MQNTSIFHFLQSVPDTDAARSTEFTASSQLEMENLQKNTLMETPKTQKRVADCYYSVWYDCFWPPKL